MDDDEKLMLRENLYQRRRVDDGLKDLIEILIKESRTNQRILIVAMCVLAGAKEIIKSF